MATAAAGVVRGQAAPVPAVPRARSGDVRPDWSRCGDYFWGDELRDSAGVKEGAPGYDP